ncbi:MAG: tetratricopeptide repeat-containing sensor histidine kinase [Flavisolibacter sp.]
MRHTRKILLFFIFLIFQPLVFYAQNASDVRAARNKVNQATHDTARVLALLAVGEVFFYHNYDSTLFYYNQGKEIAYRINYKKGIHKYISYLSGLYNTRGMYVENLALCRNGLDRAVKENDLRSQGIHLSNIGNTFLYQGLADSAAWYLINASRHLESVKDSMILGQVYANLSSAFDYLKQYDQSLLYNWLALNMATATNDHLGRGYALTNIGVAHKRASRHDSAEYYFNLAYPIAKEFNQKDLELTIATNLGLVAITSKDFQLADDYLKRALQISIDLEHVYGIVHAKKGLGSSHILQGKYEEAIGFLNEAINLAKDNGYQNELMELYEILFDAARKNGDNTIALDAYQKHIQIKDSLNNIEVQSSLASLEKQYQGEKKERLILQKDNEIKSQKMELQSMNTWIWVLCSLILLSAIIVFLLVKINRQKRQAEARQQELLNVQLSMQAKEEERHRIARELHDDLGGTLSGIVVQTHFMSQQVEHHNVTALQKSIEKISQASSEMITKLNDIIWLVNPKFDTLDQLVERIEEFANDMARARGMDFRIDTFEELEPLPLDTQARKNIYLICKEAINNAIKYSQGSELYLKVKHSGTELQLLIEDNGLGFDSAATRKGNGLNNMQDRALTIGAAYSISAGSRKGTRVKLDYKIPQ